MKYETARVPARRDWLVAALNRGTQVQPEKKHTGYIISDPFADWNEMWGHR